MQTAKAPRLRCLVVTVESPWPITNGGRARTAEVIDQLAVDYDVTVVFPGQAGTITAEKSNIRLIAAPDFLIPKIRDRVGILPRLGKAAMRTMAPEISKICQSNRRPHFVYWSHSYLAAVGMKSMPGTRHLVEFANVESQRFLSLVGSSPRLLNKLSAAAEFAKSLWWEQRCARKADLSISLHHHEASTLRAYGANVRLVPNGFKQHEYVPSPKTSKQILTMGSWTYGPNKNAIESFIATDWPDIRRSRPDMELVIAGPGSEDLLGGTVSSIDGARPLGYVEDLTQVFQACFCFLAPASSGAGSQLKIAEALSRHRIVIGPPFLGREASADIPIGAITASGDLVDSVLALSDAAERRHTIERSIAAFAKGRTWSRNFAPVRAWLAEAIDGSRGGH